MNNQEIKDQALEILKKNKVGTLATVQNNLPHSRFMTFFNDDLTLYTATNKNTHKVEEINKNPEVHILIGYGGNGIGDSFLEIEGKAEVIESDELKKRVWNPDFKKWFKGPDDPNYIILQIQTTHIRIMNDGYAEPMELHLESHQME